MSGPPAGNPKSRLPLLGAVIAVALGLHFALSRRVESQEVHPAAAWGQRLVQIYRHDSRLDAALSTNATVQVLASGFQWTEGPVWIAEGDRPGEGYLLFSDVKANKIFRWTPRTTVYGGSTGVLGTVSTFLNQSGYEAADVARWIEAARL